MGFGGSVQAMITALKNNANLRRKRKAFEGWEDTRTYKRGKPLKFKEIPKEKLKVLKAQIREKSRRERRRSIIFSILIFSLVFIFFSLYIIKLANEYKRERIVWEKERKIEQERLKKAEAEKKEKWIVHYLNNGYQWMDEGHYKNAKFEFYEAHKISKDDYRVILANTRVYVYDCIENGKGCKTAQELVDGMIQKYGEKEEVNDLIELLKTK